MRPLLRQIWIVVGVFVAAFAVSWLIYMPDASQRGVWRAQTGGQILVLSPFQARLYSETSTSCVHRLSFPAHLKLVELSQGLTVKATGDTLMLNIDGSLDPTTFERITTLPDTCGSPDPNATPRDVFDAMWTAMDEHYAFFDVYGVDWDARRALAPAAGEALTDAALFDVLVQTLEGLDDRHVRLATPPPDSTGTRPAQYSPSRPPDWYRSSFHSGTFAQMARDTVGSPLEPVALTGIEYALLPDGTGYVLMRSLAVDKPFGATRQAAMARAFEQIATAIGPAHTIIIDLRHTLGGSDATALGIASHFVAQPIDVFTKTTRNGDGQTDPFTASLAPYDGSPLTQPVIILTSGLTAASAETLILALREVAQVTIMGEATAGNLSETLMFKLPNGWDFSLSHQTYRAMDGTIYQGVGTLPDNAFTIEHSAILAGHDPLLEAALARARGG